ncbi:type I pullulanase [Clostridium sp. BJN0001]|uniref:type I pullulanase n=1 Tax=Clostridium sp. BJN0001 TaxID=2930219 RepID=UPI001FD23925|nr:type I pullulanase [Clostridium sp. BJN0001]
MDLYQNYENYTGLLGALYQKEKTKFVVWAPKALSVRLALYGKDEKNVNDPKIIKNMNKGSEGTFYLEVDGNLNGEFYNYLIKNNKEEVMVTDPYAKAVGVNGNYGMVVDLSKTNPDEFLNDKKPEYISPVSSIIYEVHIRDFSINKNSGISDKNRGKYLAFTEKNTSIPGKSTPTCINHLKKLGITHVHLLPCFDYQTVDESKLDQKEYNWGYDPQNYFVPEGSYSSNPYKGEVRIKEFKEMVMALHEEGIRVVMDMVYNHTYKYIDSNLNCAVPDYYYRKKENGEFSSGSGCGNEIASERFMVRKLIVDSVKYWAKEYHIDGFRFDLMGVTDIDTMKEIRTELDKMDKSLIMYGEGWTGGSTVLPRNLQALKENVPKFDKLQIAAFSDDTRDSIKGHVFKAEECGYVNGKKNMDDNIKACVVAFTDQKEINYNNAIYTDIPWANEPYQCVNYTSAHDNYTLWDKLTITAADSSFEERKNMNKLSAAIVLTSQGIPFFQAGEEFLRTKINSDGSINHNSYNSSDDVNNLDWIRAYEYKDVVSYYEGLINLRKKYRAFRLDTALEISKDIVFLRQGEDYYEDDVVAYKIKDSSGNNEWNDIVVIFNPNNSEAFVDLKEYGWSVLVDKKCAAADEIYSIDEDSITVSAKSAHVLIKK